MSPLCRGMLLMLLQMKLTVTRQRPAAATQMLITRCCRPQLLFLRTQLCMAPEQCATVSAAAHRFGCGTCVSCQTIEKCLADDVRCCCDRSVHVSLVGRPMNCSGTIVAMLASDRLKARAILSGIPLSTEDLFSAKCKRTINKLNTERLSRHRERPK